MCYTHHVLIFVAYVLLNPILVNCGSLNIIRTQVQCPKGADFDPTDCCLAALEAYEVDFEVNNQIQTYLTQVQHGVYHYAELLSTPQKWLRNKTGLYKIDVDEQCTFNITDKITLTEKGSRCRYSVGQKSVFKGCYNLRSGGQILEAWTEPGVNNALMLLKRGISNNCSQGLYEYTPSNGDKRYYEYDNIDSQYFFKDSVMNGIFDKCKSVTNVV